MSDEIRREKLNACVH